MQTSEVKNLIDSLKLGRVWVKFKKIGTGEIRNMESTLNPDLLKEAGIETVLESVNPESDHIAVWCIDKNAWRSFRVNTVISWETE
tara:strand:+ start:8182 stop:8439 length:258 start_codon:yes stop_codon:yes gene_type:complete